MEAATLIQHPAVKTAEELVADYISLKQFIEDKKQELLSIEQSLVDTLGSPEEGTQKTQKVGNWKVTLKAPFTYSFPKEASDDQIKATNDVVVASGHASVFKQKTELSVDKKALESLRESSPQWFAQYVSPVLVGKAGKIGIEVKA